MQQIRGTRASRSKMESRINARGRSFQEMEWVAELDRCSCAGNPSRGRLGKGTGSIVIGEWVIDCMEVRFANKPKCSSAHHEGRRLSFSFACSVSRLLRSQSVWPRYCRRRRGKGSTAYSGTPDSDGPRMTPSNGFERVILGRAMPCVVLQSTVPTTTTVWMQMLRRPSTSYSEGACNCRGSRVQDVMSSHPEQFLAGS